MGIGSHQSSVFPSGAINSVKENFRNKNRETITTGMSRGPVDILKKMFSSLSLFQPKPVGGSVAKTVLLFDILLHHCQGE